MALGRLALLAATWLAPASALARPVPHHRQPAGRHAADANAARPHGAPGAGPTFAGRTEVVWLGHAAWQLRSPGGALVIIDPWLDNPQAPARVELPEALDAIVVTHGHFDHVGNAVALARRTNARVIASPELLDLLGLPDALKVGVGPGGAVVVRDVTVHLTEAVHASSLTRGEVTHYAGAALGVVLTIEHGPTFYHAGDTDVFASMALIASRFRPKVAMLPIGGHLTMGPEGAALAAGMLGVDVVLPMHYGTFPQLAGTPEALAKLLPPRVTMKAVQAGAVLTF